MNGSPQTLRPDELRSVINKVHSSPYARERFDGQSRPSNINGRRSSTPLSVQPRRAAHPKPWGARAPRDKSPQGAATSSVRSRRGSVGAASPSSQASPSLWPSPEHKMQSTSELLSKFDSINKHPANPNAYRMYYNTKQPTVPKRESQRSAENKQDANEMWRARDDELAQLRNELMMTNRKFEELQKDLRRMSTNSPRTPMSHTSPAAEDPNERQLLEREEWTTKFLQRLSNLRALMHEAQRFQLESNVR